MGFGPHVAAGPCGVRVGRGLDCGLGLPVEVFLAASGELGEVGELAEQESGHVFLAFGVHMHETAFMRVHVLHHLVELDIRCDFAELVVPVFAFGLQGWLDCRFGFARVPPHFEIDLRLAFRTDFLACLPFLFFDFLFDQFGYFRVTSAEASMSSCGTPSTSLTTALVPVSCLRVHDQPNRSVSRSWSRFSCTSLISTRLA